MESNKFTVGPAELDLTIDFLTYSTQLLSLTARDLQALGASKKDPIKTALRQIDDLDAIINQLVHCQFNERE